MTNSPIEPRHKDMAANMLSQSYDRILTIAQTLANLEAARADLAEIDRIALLHGWTPSNKGKISEPASLIAAIAAPYRAKVDPLVEAFNRMPPTFDAAILAETARKTLDDLGLEIVERRDR